MWPWGHLAVGYLAYVAFGTRDVERAPGDRPTLALAVATQLPDVVDKTLAWHLGVLPNGRSLGHSLVVAALVLGVVAWVAARYGGRDVAVAGGIGYLSHLAADAVVPLVGLRFGELAFLAWPLLPAVPEAESRGVLGYFAELVGDLAAGQATAFFAFELALTALAVGLWVHHGCPGTPLGRRRRDPPEPAG